MKPVRSARRPARLRQSALWKKVAREKAAARRADERAIASGRLSVEELERRNALFPAHLFALDYDVASRIW